MANKSESIGKLALALAKAQGAMKPALKDSTNPFFKNDYADLKSVWEACRAALEANELSVTQVFSGENLTTILLHSSGEWVSGEMPLFMKSKDPQQYGSAATYARRYALAAIVGVVQSDDDGEAALGRNSQPAKINSKATSGPVAATFSKTGPEPYKGRASQLTGEKLRVTDAQLKRLFALSQKAQLSEDRVKDMAGALGHEGSRKDMTRDVYDKLCAEIQELIPN